MTRSDDCLASRRAGRARHTASIAAFLLLIAFGALGVLVRGGATPADRLVIDALNAASAGPIRSALDFLTFIGLPAIWDTAVVALAALMWWRGLRTQAVVLVVSLAAIELAANVSKLAFDRPRPNHVVVADLITQASYPSGHVARTVISVALLAVFATHAPRTRLTALALAAGFCLAMGAARIVSGEHWPTDVLGAYLLGAAGVVIAVSSPKIARCRARSRGSAMTSSS